MSAVTVEKRWITSVLASLVLSILVAFVNARHVFSNFSPMVPNEYSVVLIAAIVMAAVSFAAFVDFFAIDLSVRVKKQVEISKKELMEAKRRHEREQEREGP